MLELLTKTLTQTAITVAHTWPYLRFAVVLAAVLKVHVEPARLRAWLARHQRASVVGAIGLGVATPLCSCGTMALVLAMLTTSMPWAPIVAFMVASPLTSPGQLLYTAGLFGWTFAGFHFAIAIVLGFAGAAAAADPAVAGLAREPDAAPSTGARADRRRQRCRRGRLARHRLWSARRRPALREYGAGGAHARGGGSACCSSPSPSSGTCSTT